MNCSPSGAVIIISGLGDFRVRPKTESVKGVLDIPDQFVYQVSEFIDTSSSPVGEKIFLLLSSRRHTKN